MRNLCLASVIACAMGAPAVAQEMEIAEELFRHYCATCHGFSGEGDGEMVPYLTLSMPDLTQLSRDNGGEFPLSKVIMVIDGRSKPRGHLGPMPFFAPMFQREEMDAQDEYQATLDAQGRILLLARYLETLQDPDD